MSDFDKLLTRFEKTCRLAVSADGPEGDAASRQGRKLCSSIIRHQEFGGISVNSQLWYFRWYVQLAEDKFQQLEDLSLIHI